MPCHLLTYDNNIPDNNHKSFFGKYLEPWHRSIHAVRNRVGTNLAPTWHAGTPLHEQQVVTDACFQEQLSPDLWEMRLGDTEPC